MSEPLVEIHDLTKVFAPSFPPALKKINAQIPPGEIVGLVGPDGAGKTTLIRVIAALLHPSEGNVTIAGKDSVKDAEFVHKNSGYMPQKFGLYEDLTVLQNLNLYADLRSVRGEEKQATFKKLLSFTGLDPFQNRLAGALSGGMKQKLGLACALIKKPTLLLLDEPSVGVDPISRRELWKMVHALLDEGISVVWSTAYLDEAEKCHTVILLNRGELLYFGKPESMTKRVDGRVFLKKDVAKNRRQVLAHFLNQENVIDGIIQGKDVRIVFKEGAGASKEGLVAVQARFEDGFIDILDGGPGGKSLLAEARPPLPPNGGTVVSAENLTKKFGSFTAVNHIDIAVKKGEVFGLLGPNGAGKTTAFKMLCGLLTPTSGKATINGLDLQHSPGKARAQIGYMPQKFSLYGNLTVLQNLTFFSGIYNLSGARQKEAIDLMVKIFDLKKYLSSSADLIPLGFKQRLSLACATMHNPPILFLDEPTSGVDPITRREFWNHINGLVEKGVTVLVTTHFMDEAEFCDRIALVYRGQVITMDKPDVLKQKASSEDNPNPSLEDAFIRLIEVNDAPR
jgi:ABC-2 type transport system ATP-binding protein